MDDTGEERASELRGRIGLLAGPLWLVAVLLVGPPGGLDPAAWRAAGAGLWMATWWVTEAIPIPATALLPLVLFPLLGVADIDASARPFANDIIFLFLGGFLLAVGMERWGLPRRIALAVVGAVGTGPRAVVAGFMASTALLSMWVSNTATAMMMLPIGVSVLRLVEPGSGEEDDPGGGFGDAADAARADTGGNFGICLMLGIAFGANIGGLGTLIGTPPNAFLAAFLSETYGFDVGFVRWMAIGLPLVLVGLPLSHLLLTRVVFPLRLEELPGGRDLIRRERASLGPASPAERRVAAVFVLVALAWITRPLLDDLVPGLSDAGIAVAGGLALFLVPAGVPEGGALLGWRDAERLPWGVLVLFGGGLSLASALQSTGFAGWIGGEAGRWLEAAPLLLVVVVPTAVIVLLTELTSNTATAAAFLPILASVAIGLGESPLLLAVPAAVGASCAFMLPVATPPNAIVFGSGAVSVPQMARAGAGLNLLFVVLATLVAWLLLPLVFGVEFGVVPGWAVGP